MYIYTFCSRADLIYFKQLRVPENKLKQWMRTIGLKVYTFHLLACASLLWTPLPLYVCLYTCAFVRSVCFCVILISNYIALVSISKSIKLWCTKIKPQWGITRKPRIDIPVCFCLCASVRYHASKCRYVSVDVCYYVLLCVFKFHVYIVYASLRQLLYVRGNFYCVLSCEH